MEPGEKARQDRVREALESGGVRCEVRAFPSSTKTSQEAADALGIDVSCIAKSIAFDCEGRTVIVVASGSNRVSREKLFRLTGARPRTMGPDQVLEATGFPAGGVPPLGHRKGIRIFIDSGLMGKKEVWAAAGTLHSVFRIAPEELVRVTGGQVADVKE
jgi:prolyl-tRNA editing enzyme YbaK/EbsC (Cys-tRNA(Pro) deacylase)